MKIPGLLLFLCFILPLHAQSVATGSVAGVVSNAGTGAFLEGARVQVPALNRETRTDASGRFAFPDIPPGDYEVVATYLGLDAGRQRVSVGGGRRASAVFELGSNVYQMSAYTVVSEREGNAASLMQQQLSDHVVNVVSVDAYGNVADGNIGNFFQRLPGVATSEGDGGEVKGLILRGAPPDLSLVTLDGTRLASSDTGGGRAADVSRIPAELIKQVEVNKALTPEMEVDGIGGSANLTTKSAFDFRNRYVHYRFAYSLNTYRDGNPWQPYYTLTAMDAFGKDRKFGVAFTASYNRIVNPVDRVFGQYLETDYRNTTARLLDDVLDREKWGVGVKLEYRFDDTAQVWFNTLRTNTDHTSERYNWQVVAGGNRRVADYARVSRAAIEAGTAARDSANQTAGVAPGFTPTYTELLSASLINQPALIGPVVSRQVLFDIGGEKKWNDYTIRARATHSPAKTTTDSGVASFTLPGIGVAIDTSDGMPRFHQLYGPTIWAGSDFSRYTMTWQYQPSQAEEDYSTAQLDATRQLRRGELDLKVKSGVKFRRQTRSFVTNNPRWNYVGPDGVAGRNATTGLNDDNIAQFFVGPAYALFNGRYAAVDKPSVPRVQAVFRDHPEYFRNSNAVNDIRDTPHSEVIEDVSAGYLMARGALGRRLTFVGGARYEVTDVEATGTFSSSSSRVVTTTSREGDYAKLFPSLHGTYALRPNLLLRAAYSTSMARPSLRSITPTTTVTESATGGLGTVTQNNINLKPQYSTNYDVMIEYYLNPAGVLSAGVFRKNVTDFIATFRRDIANGSDNGFDGAYAGYVLNTSTNLGTARIEGYELNYSQQLTQLPKPFNGLSAFANYTYLRTSGSYDNGATALANFVPETANAGVSYANRGVSIQVVYNYKSPFLASYSPTPLQSAWQTKDDQYDVNVQYRFRPWLSAYVDVNNVFNTAPSTYSLDESRTYIWQKWGTKVTVGISGRF